MNLGLALRTEGDIPVLSVSGELDMAVVGQVEQALVPVEARRPPVLRLVLEADIRARRDGRRLVVVRGPDPVHRVFTVTALDKRLKFVADPADIGSVRS